jgi:multimeric flavodoxin WrbA
MQVVAFNGSPRKDGNTTALLHHALRALEAEGIETELIQLAGSKLQGCRACRACFRKQDQRCIIEDDMLNDCVQSMIAADGILLGSPTYFADLTAEMKALIDRAGFVGFANGRLWRRKVGAAVVAVRRAGSIHVFDSINHFFLINEMIVPGSTYWNVGIGREKGEVEEDEEGVRTMENLGRNMAWLLHRLKEGAPGSQESGA